MVEPAAVLKLIVAVAIALEVRPEDLAEIFDDGDRVQEYYDILLAQAGMR